MKAREASVLSRSVFVLHTFPLLNRNTFLMEVLKHISNISFSCFSYDNKEERDDNPL